MQVTSMLGQSVKQRKTDDSLQSQAYGKIKEKIISGELPPASLIDDKALAEELQLGYTPIRQALRWLALENLVVILPRRGTIVADMNFGDLQKIWEVRIELVPLAYRLAGERVTGAQIARMEAVLAEAKATLTRGTPMELLTVDRTLQELAIEASQNEFLIEILERLHSQAMRFWRLDRIGEVDLRREVRQHHQVVALLKRGRGDAAAKLIAEIITEFHRAQTQGR